MSIIDKHVRSLLTSIRSTITEVVLAESRTVPTMPKGEEISLYYPVRPGGHLGQAIPYVCAQVGRAGRGSIGVAPDGNIVMHFTPTREDCTKQLTLIPIEEMWVVLRSPKGASS
jgi:hypothetical protein